MKKNNGKACFAADKFIILCFAAAACRAQEFKLEDYTVLSARPPMQSYEMPGDVTVLTAGEIEESGALDITDLLEARAGVLVRSHSGNPSQAEVSMRGFGENSHGRVLVLLNGRRLNRPDMASINWLQVPLASVERVEIVRGNRTVLYGDNALAGVINIITKTGGEEPSFSASASAGSDGLNAQRAGASGSRDGASFAVELSRMQTGGYRDRSAFLAMGGYGQFGYAFSGRLSVDLTASYDRSKYEMPGPLTLEQMRQNPRQSVNPDDNSEDAYMNAGMGVKAEFSDDIRVDVDLFYGRKEHDTDMPSWQMFFADRIDTWSLMPRVTLRNTLFKQENRLLVGVDTHWDGLAVDNYPDAGRAYTTLTADIDKRMLGAYARDEHHFTENFYLSAGARMEQARYSATASSGGATTLDDSSTHNAAAAEASLVYLLPQRSKLFAGLGTVYRFPFVDEQFSYYGYNDRMYEDLSPEKGVNYEMGADAGITDQARAGLTLFLMDMRDEIAWNQATRANENLDAARRMGLEASASWRPVNWFGLWANYTFTRARFTDGDNDGKDVPLVPAHKGSVGGEFTAPVGLTLGAAATMVSSQHLGGDNGNTQDKMESYTTVKISAAYSHPRAAWLRAFAEVDNVFDEEYAGQGYYSQWDGCLYYPAQGRSWRAGLSARF